MPNTLDVNLTFHFSDGFMRCQIEEKKQKNHWVGNHEPVYQFFFIFIFVGLRCVMLFFTPIRYLPFKRCIKNFTPYLHNFLGCNNYSSVLVTYFGNSDYFSVYFFFFLVGLFERFLSSVNGSEVFFLTKCSVHI